ncbi:MAG: hypothetical protein IPN33_17315 [Saprospiraceae bacterium]|nr:hypothetical protein [Saprospiraceae bacterium]
MEKVRPRHNRARACNLTSVDTNNDGTPEATDDACGDLPALDVEKTFVSAALQANGTYNVIYTITVSNEGGAGQYDLKDTPGLTTILPSTALHTLPTRRATVAAA